MTMSYAPDHVSSKAVCLHSHGQLGLYWCRTVADLDFDQASNWKSPISLRTSSRLDMPFRCTCCPVEKQFTVATADGLMLAVDAMLMAEDLGS